MKYVVQPRKTSSFCPLLPSQKNFFSFFFSCFFFVLFKKHFEVVGEGKGEKHFEVVGGVCVGWGWGGVGGVCGGGLFY